MAILFDRIPADELGTKYTHYGRFYGFVPVYMGDPYGMCPDVAVRNGWPDWLLYLGDMVFSLACWACQAIDPQWENSGFFYVVTGEIKRNHGKAPQP